MTIQTPAQIIKNHGIKPDKLLGQNFLNSIYILEDIVNALNPTKEDTVFEFGSGPGTISALLYDKCLKVTGIEKDKRMISIAKEEFPQVEFIEGDIRSWNPPEISENNKIKFVGNLPYYLTSFFLRRFLDWRYLVAVFMVQKEVGDKIVCDKDSSERGFLTTIVNAKSTPVKLFDVDKNSFFPPPEVDSSVLMFEPKEIGWNLKAEKLAETCFAHKRQTMLRSMRRMLDKDKAEAVLNAAGVDLKMRPEDLLPEDFIRISNHL